MGAEQSTPAADASSIAADKPPSSSPRPSALVICGPSGVGKGTLIKRLLDSGGKYGFSVSHTTRAPRPGEQDGVHYHFTTREAMEKDVAEGLFLETAQVHNNLYGTSKQAVQDTLAAGKVAILDVDVQGARAIRSSGIAALFVFIAPPSLEELERRLRGRGTETPVSMTRRIKSARHEISSLNEKGLYDYLLLNDDLDTTAAELERIAERAMRGLPAEPGQVPDEVRFEEDEEGEDEQAAAARASSGAGASTSNAAAAAAAGLAAAALPEGNAISTTPRPHDHLSPRAVLPGHAEPAAGTRNVLGGTVERPRTSGTPSAQLQHAGAGPAGAAAAAAGQRMVSGLQAWRGKVAVVTGASSGIGWGVCEALGRAGLRVVAVARRREQLQELREAVTSPKVGMQPDDFLPVVCDVTKEAEVSALPAIITKHWPDAGIDVLVNNAGLSRSQSSLFDGRVECWLEMVSTNILGTAMMTRAALQDMQRRRSWGHIINMVGLSGHRIPDAAAGGTFFAATKYAVRALTEGMRQEARAKDLPLRVSGISPGLVETNFFKVRAFGDDEAAKAVVSSMQCLQPEDVAEAVLWCLSAPSHVNVCDVIVRPTEQLI